MEVIKLTSPNGGETFMSGQTYTITWQTKATRTPVAKTVLRYTMNGGLTRTTITAVMGNPGTVSWTVPPTALRKDKCSVQVILKNAAGVTVGSDKSNAFFAIQPPL